MWVQERKLVASDAFPTDEFGHAVHLSGDFAWVGTPFDNRGEDAGAAYPFRFRDGVWVSETKLVASQGAKADRFGTSVSAGSGRVLVGSTRGRGRGSESGPAIFYVFHPCRAATAERRRERPIRRAHERGTGHREHHRGAARGGVGAACFSFLVSPNRRPVVIWNNAGRRNRIGRSVYFGIEQPDPARAPVTLLDLPAGDPGILPVGSCFTVQAL